MAPLTMSLSVLLLLAFSGIATSQTIVDTLPGWNGTLPFKLETGYIGVDDLDEVQLFYYFVESERNPVEDPLMLWLTGGPGCSGFSALAYEIGPFSFDLRYNGSIPSIVLNPYSWTKWLYAHPTFLGNQLYIGGDSYSGLIVPILLQKILEGLESGLRPRMELQGYLLGNPVTDYFIDENERIPYGHRVSLISDEIYEAAKTNCSGDYIHVEINNTLCITALQKIKDCLLQINVLQILEPHCAFASGKTSELEWDLRAREASTMDRLLSESKLPELHCRGYTYVLAYKWMNDETVRAALGVRNGTVDNWVRCPKALAYYTKEITSSIPYQKNLSETGLRALIYSGDHDLSVPWIATQYWIKALDVPVFDEWRPWYVNGQIAGYQVKFMNDDFRLTYVTVKGAGHTAPEYKHYETLAMFDRFLARYPI